MNNDSVFNRMRERYRSGNIPWDDPLPPPEVSEVVTSLKPGRALDLGCGFGRAAIYMAINGWEVDAIDFLPEAIVEARKRAEDIGPQLRFHVGSVLELSFLTGVYDLAIDVGCCHNMSNQELQAYRKTLSRLLKPGALFLVFARLRENSLDQVEGGPRGLDETDFVKIFHSSFRLLWVKRGETLVDDQPTWPSAWFQFQRI